MRIAASAVLALALAAGPAAAGDKVHRRAGTSSAPFLKIGAGARPVGMGEAFTGVADDVNALYWNPAGLTSVDRPHFGATHQEAYQGLDHEFFGYGQPLMVRQDGRWRRAGRRAAWGLSLSILSVPGDLERRAEEGAGALGQLTAPQGSFGAADMAFAGTFAWAHGRDSFGISGKLIRQSIDRETAHSGAVDLGWLRREALPGLSVGASLLHLGPGVRFNQRWYPLPLALRAGAGYRLEGIRGLVAMDLWVPRDDFPYLSLGGEFGVLEAVKLRAGYRYRWHGLPQGGLAGFRTGLGLVYKNLDLDYAAAPFGELGISHRFSLGWRFAAPWGTDPAGAAAPAGSAPASAVAPAPRAPPAVPPPPPELPMPTAAPAPIVEPGPQGAFRVRAALKSLSARGGDFLITAEAPSADWDLRRVEFRARIPSADGVTVAVSRARAGTPLPEGAAPSAVFTLSSNAAGQARSVFVTLRGAGGAASVMGLVDGAWRALPSEAVDDGGVPALRASSERFPDAVAVVGGP